MMNYLRGEGVIRYFHKVEMKSKELTFSADTLNVTLDEEAKGARRVMAEGNVFVRRGGRVCRGDTAEWILAADGYVVVKGNPATIDDPALGRSTARRLTYFQDKDRIVLEP
jgi:lipopolysaccharide export system protein LptA